MGRKLEMDPFQVSSSWFMHCMFQSLAPAVLVSFLFQINPRETDNSYYETQSEQIEIAWKP